MNWTNVLVEQTELAESFRERAAGVTTDRLLTEDQASLFVSEVYDAHLAQMPILEEMIRSHADTETISQAVALIMQWRHIVMTAERKLEAIARLAMMEIRWPH